MVTNYCEYSALSGFIRVKLMLETQDRNPVLSRGELQILFSVTLRSVSMSRTTICPSLGDLRWCVKKQEDGDSIMTHEDGDMRQET